MSQTSLISRNTTHSQFHQPTCCWRLCGGEPVYTTHRIDSMQFAQINANSITFNTQLACPNNSTMLCYNCPLVLHIGASPSPKTVDVICWRQPGLQRARPDSLQAAAASSATTRELGTRYPVFCVFLARTKKK